jgi:hypothetical protein
MNFALRKSFILFALVGLFAFAHVSEAAQTYINEDKVLVIDGKRVFPIGFTMPPPIDGKTPTGKNGIKEISDAGATFLRAPYWGYDWDEEKTFRHTKEVLDAAAKNKMHTWVWFKELSGFNPGDKTKEELFRKIVTRFKDHPGMGAWKGADEPEWGKDPVPPLQHAYNVLKQVDPETPLVIIQAPRGTVESLKTYVPALDILGTDIYPIGYPPGAHSHLTNKEISVVGDYTRRMYEVLDGKPDTSVWMTLQFAWSGVSNPGKTLRFPTFPEQRFMVYQAIINGARGIVYFGGGLESTLNARDRKLGWNWTYWDRVLRQVVEEIGTKSPVYPALLVADSKLPVKVSHPKHIEFCVREVGKEIFVLACNRNGDETVKVDFRGLPEEVRGSELLFEEPRRVEAKKGVFSDYFGPYEVHVYRFVRK